MTVRLRAVVEADLEPFFQQQADPESVRMAAFPARSREEHLAVWRRSLGEDTTVARTIEVDGVCAGHVVAFLPDGADDVLVGYWLGRSFWGRGVASAALEQFLAVEARRPLVAHVATHNLASRRVLEKCGFRLQTLVPDAMGDGVDEWHFRLD